MRSAKFEVRSKPDSREPYAVFAAIYIPDFAVEAIVRLKPELRERAVAVLEGTPPLVRVVAVNDRAAEAGLEPGTTKVKAEELAAACNGMLAMRSLQQEESAQSALLDVASAFSPRVEATAPGIAVLDLDGLERIFGPVAKIARDLARRCSEIGLESHVAVAANPDCAVHAARGFDGVTVIPEGREAERLATLPVDVLTVTAPKELAQSTQGPQRKQSQKSSASSSSSASNPPVINPEELLNTFESWGVRNLRSLAALPEVAVTERLGQAGLHWQRMARGATKRALKLVDLPARFEETCELEYPVESLEPLSFVLNRMLEQLCARLSARALATNEIRTTLTLEINDDRDIRSSDHRVNKTHDQMTRSPDEQMTRSLRLPVPMLDAKVFLKLLQLDLQAHPPGAPVVKISIEAHPAEPRRTQGGLFEASAPEPERLEVTLARIQSTVDSQQSAEKKSGEWGVGSAEILDTHTPDAFRMKRFVAAGLAQNRTSEIGKQKSVTALRIFRPAVSVQVIIRGGKPARIECEIISGDVTWCAGPWKSSGEWWNEQPWAREEWDVCVGGAAYRIYHEPKGWFVEGTYD